MVGKLNLNGEPAYISESMPEHLQPVLILNIKIKTLKKSKGFAVNFCMISNAKHTAENILAFSL